MRAETIAKALRARKARNGWLARCPAHDDHDPSLSIQDVDGKVLVYCHAGCNQFAVIAALKERGLWEHGAKPSIRADSHRPITKQPEHNDETRHIQAAKIWRAAVPVSHTLGETYLSSRGIKITLPPTLRFHAKLKHYPSGSFRPAMVALVTRVDNVPIAIHRTYLASDGKDKAPVKPQKMMLGPCRGGAVRLGTVSDLVLISEGIENALSVMQATGLPAWAGLSASFLPKLKLPSQIKKVILLGDSDEASEKATHEAALRWIREGRNVRIARPAPGYDFNDMLLGRHLQLRQRGAA